MLEAISSFFGKESNQQANAMALKAETVCLLDAALRYQDETGTKPETLALRLCFGGKAVKTSWIDGVRSNWVGAMMGNP